MSMEVKLDTKKLESLIEAFEEIPIVKVGILAAKNDRLEENTNAMVGVRHEFGEGKMPQRSFLRMPLTDQLGKEMEQAGAFDEEKLETVIKEKSIREYVAKIGVLGERVIAMAFDTGGFGFWKPSNMTYKKNKQTLVETQQLRNSITSEVEE